MEERPLSLTIIAWLLILGGAFGLYTAATMSSNEGMLRLIELTGLPLQFHEFIVSMNGIVSLASAYGIFKGRPWSRVMVTGWSIVTLTIGFFTSPIRWVVIVTAVLTAIFTYFLFRQAADRWFRATALQLHRRDG